MASTLRIKPGPHWWQVNALTTAPPLLPFFSSIPTRFIRRPPPLSPLSMSPPLGRKGCKEKSEITLLYNLQILVYTRDLQDGFKR